MLTRRTEPKMAVIKQKGDTMFLGGDRIVVGNLLHGKILHRQFKADRRARIGADRAGDDQRRFLREMIGKAEGFGRNIILEYDALDHAGAVPHLEEMELATRPLVVQPTL